MPNKQRCIDTLNELLKGELMAMEIYAETDDIQGDQQVMGMLDQFARDHKEHAQLLADRIRELGGTPVTGTGMAGAMVGLASKINALRGPAHLLKQLYDGEDKGIHAYEDRIDELDPRSQNLVQGIMSADHDHLKFFKARMESEKDEH
ncbi:MAG: DUF2383 domain-containing protein [Bacillota bacterium]|nr:DUF2383 domain-containing protein [Bacillota bacterium]HHT90870.1 DUF2383 domain-containing protein [Bacillota bacterium]